MMPYVELFKDLYIDMFLTGCKKWDQAKLCWKKAPEVEVTKGGLELCPNIFQWTKPWSCIAESYSQTQELPSHFGKDSLHISMLLFTHLTLTANCFSLLLTNKTSVFLFIECKFFPNKLTFSAYIKW
jgi:hypothetical protein